MEMRDAANRQHTPSRFLLTQGHAHGLPHSPHWNMRPQHPEVFQNFQRLFKGRCSPPRSHLAAGTPAPGCDPWPESPFLFQPRAASQAEKHPSASSSLTGATSALWDGGEEGMEDACPRLDLSGSRDSWNIGHGLGTLAGPHREGRRRKWPPLRARALEPDCLT